MPTPYTPGPWQWDECQHVLRAVKPDPDVSDVHTIIEPDYIGWGFAFSKHEDTHAEMNGNLRLIQAAPELFEALEIAEAFMAGFEDDEAQEHIEIQLAIIRSALESARSRAFK